MAYIFHDRFSGNILLDIETTRHIFGIIYLTRVLFIWEGLLGWKRARVGLGKTYIITNLLRTNTAHFIVGIMSLYVQGSAYQSMLYFRRGLHAILIRIIFKQTAEVPIRKLNRSDVCCVGVRANSTFVVASSQSQRVAFVTRSATEELAYMWLYQSQYLSLVTYNSPNANWLERTVIDHGSVGTNAFILLSKYMQVSFF